MEIQVDKTEKQVCHFGAFLVFTKPIQAVIIQSQTSEETWYCIRSGPF